MFEWLAEADDSPRVVLDPFAENRLSGLSVEGDAISILVGPEGGFTQEEADAVRLSGLTAFSLGPRVLRTETARLGGK